MTIKEKTLNFLEAHLSDTPSTFVEDAKLRKENETWLRWSRRVALCIVDYMQENSLTRSDIAEKLGFRRNMSVAYSREIQTSRSRVLLRLRENSAYPVWNQ